MAFYTGPTGGMLIMYLIYVAILWIPDATLIGFFFCQCVLTFLSNSYTWILNFSYSWQDTQCHMWECNRDAHCSVYTLSWQDQCGQVFSTRVCSFQPTSCAGHISSLWRNSQHEERAKV